MSKDDTNFYTSTTPTIEQTLRRELGKDEKLLWSGLPRQGFIFRSSDIVMIPFSLVWGGFAIFWESSVIAATNAPFFFKLWGIPFVLMGLYIIVGRFFLDIYQRRNTYYGLTNQRILILKWSKTRQVRTLSLQNLSEMSFTEKSNGSGNILFAGVSPMYSMWYSMSWPRANGRFPPSFDSIEDVRKVYDLIKDQQRAIA